MKIYTRTGDEGRTSLFGGKRVAKNDARIEAYGTVDELNSFLGAIPGLADIQSDLFEIGAHLASPGTSKFSGVDPARIEDLERAIDEMERELAPLASFILPGGCAEAVQFHIARTVCRRAERRVVALEDETPATRSTIAYLNRLSDYLFVAARYANHKAGIADVPWSKR